MNSSPRWNSYSRPLPPLDLIRAEIARRTTERKLQEIRDNEAEIRRRCRTLTGFVREAWPILHPSASMAYVHGWHIDAVAKHLEAITYGQFLAMGLENRLLINEPFGMMKSLLVSVLWPAWEWGPCGMPEMSYISTSHTGIYVARDSRKMRDLVASEWYQTLWGDHVKLVRTGETSFENDRRGFRNGIPFQSLTSGRAGRLIIDDPNSVDGADSDADREGKNSTFRDSATSRLIDPVESAIVVVQHRLHEDDVSGTILRLKLPYIHLMLPMEFEPDRRCVTPIFADPRTHEGELLFPERFPPAVIARDKGTMTPRAWAGQAQQRPAPLEGGTFKREWFEIVGAVPAGYPIRWVRHWDLAGTEKNSGNEPAWTAGVLLGRAWNGVYYVADVTRVRLDSVAVRRIITQVTGSDYQRFGEVEVSFPQDPGSAGKMVARDMVTMLDGFNAWASPETGSKEQRAEPVAAQAAAGNVKLVKGPWNEAFLDEVTTFPGSRFKDQVDALSGAYARHQKAKVAKTESGPMRGTS